MKNTDKVTLTFGQLKRLIKESKSNSLPKTYGEILDVLDDVKLSLNPIEVWNHLIYDAEFVLKWLNDTEATYNPLRDTEYSLFNEFLANYRRYFQQFENAEKMRDWMMTYNKRFLKAIIKICKALKTESSILVRKRYEDKLI